MSLITKSTYLRGPKGDIGLQGPRGERGLPGATGPQGPAGEAQNLGSTDALPEGGANLYYTSARARSVISGGNGVTYNNSTGEIAIGQSVSSIDNVTFADINASGNVQIDGNLTVNGTTTTINATELAIEDNLIYLNNSSAVTNPDLGIAGNYNDGTYAHTGIFRDASDGYWKVFDSYTLEPDASPYINTSHSSFNLAKFQANEFKGNLDGNALTATKLLTSKTISGIAFDGSANITLNTSNITEGSNQYFTIARARTSIDVSGDLSYDSINGIISYTTPFIPTKLSDLTNDSGYIRTSDTIDGGTY